MLVQYHHHRVPGLLQTSEIVAFQPSLSSVLLMSSLMGDSFLVTKLFRLSVYFVRCRPLLLVPQIFPLNICFSSPSALFICPKNCSYLFLMFWVGIFCIQPFPLLLHLTSFRFMIFSFFFWCTTFLLLQVFFLGLLSMSSIHIHTEGWTICRLSEGWFWCKLWYFCRWRWTSSCWMCL